jgi:exodeoxyribonuclease VII small subunit
MATPVTELTYTQAISELERIIAHMQSDKCDIDKLSDYTRRATELLKECKKRLTASDQELRTILASLEN